MKRSRKWKRPLAVLWLAVVGVALLEVRCYAQFVPTYDPTLVSTYMGTEFGTAIVPVVAGVAVFFWFLRLLRRAK